MLYVRGRGPRTIRCPRKVLPCAGKRRGRAGACIPWLVAMMIHASRCIEPVRFGCGISGTNLEYDGGNAKVIARGSPTRRKGVGSDVEPVLSGVFGVLDNIEVSSQE